MNYTNMRSPLIISIDGNIGSGKSSVMRYLEKNFEEYVKLNKKELQICFLQEPVSIWEGIRDVEDGKNAIEKFYQDNEKYSFAFQMMAYISRLSLLKKAIAAGYNVIFTERSMLTDRNIFAQMLYDSKKMDSIEYQIYQKWFDEFSDCIRDIKIVYIQTTPEICDRRVQKRARLGECIPLSYLQTCHKYHETWLNNMEKIEQGNILIINGNEETDTTRVVKNKFYDGIIDKVYLFMNN